MTGISQTVNEAAGFQIPFSDNETTLPPELGMGGLRVSSLLHRSPNWRSGGLCDRYVKAAIETFSTTA